MVLFDHTLNPNSITISTTGYYEVNYHIILSATATTNMQLFLTLRQTVGLVTTVAPGGSNGYVIPDSRVLLSL